MTIASISDGCIQRLCAGQVITTLATCVKELVENSIDASSKNIEIVFKNSGMDSISVSDDGTGILKEDFPFLGQRHFTSKIRDFDDLSIVQSYGFRGEALFSIATVSTACTVISKHAKSTEELGMKLEWRNGEHKLTGAPRKAGTSIIVDELFSKYPVRHKEFHRGIKTQFSDAIEVLTGYALANPQVRFVCYNIPKSSANRLLIFQSSGNGSLIDVCKDLFTTVKVKSFLPFDFESSINACKRCYGCISREMPASKNSFIFFNSRPCDYRKITKAINDSYRKQFEPKGNLFVILHVVYESNAIDVNVTPDKRKIFIRNEKEFLDYLLEKLGTYFHKLSGMNAVNALLPSPVSQKTSSLLDILKERQPLNQSLAGYESKIVDSKPAAQVELSSFVNVLESSFCSKGLLSCKNGTSRPVASPSRISPPKTVDQHQPNLLPLLSPAVAHDLKPIEQPNNDKEFIPTRQCHADSPNCSCKDLPNDPNNVLFVAPTVCAEEPSYLCKSDLSNMKVVGQFNLGFIVVHLERNGKKELYIVDQHAADEKYNFEKMFSSFNPTIQKLIHPIQIELSSSEEAFIQTNLEEFKRCGFHLVLDMEREPGKRTSIEATAVFDGMHFDSNGI